MLKVDPDERPSAEEIVEYIEQIGKVYRPTSGKNVTESKPRQVNMLRTIRFTDSFSEIQEQLPKKNYQKKFENTKFHSFDGGSEGLPSIKVKSKKNSDSGRHGSGEKLRREFESSEENSLYHNRGHGLGSRSRSAKHGVDREVHHNERSLAIDREPGVARYRSDHTQEDSLSKLKSKNKDHQAEHLQDTKFFEDIDAEINKDQNLHINRHIPLQSSQNSHDLKHQPQMQRKNQEIQMLIEDQDHGHSLPLQEIYLSENEERVSKIAKDSKYHLNPKIGMIKHQSRELNTEKLDSQEYAKLLEIEKKRKRLYKLLMDSHSEEISEILDKYKIQDRKYHSKSIDQYRSSPKPAKPSAPSKYPKLPALLVEGKPERKQKVQSRAFVRNYHDIPKGVRLYDQAPRSVQRGNHSPKPEWWG